MITDFTSHIVVSFFPLRKSFIAEHNTIYTKSEYKNSSLKVKRYISLKIAHEGNRRLNHRYNGYLLMQGKDRIVSTIGDL